MSRLDPTNPDEPDDLVTAPDPVDAKTEPGGVINPAKDGATGGWGTAARWFLFALLLIVLIWGYLWLAGDVRQ